MIDLRGFNRSQYAAFYEDELPLMFITHRTEKYTEEEQTKMALKRRMYLDPVTDERESELGDSQKDRKDGRIQ